MVVKNKKISKKEIGEWMESLNYSQFQRLCFFETKLMWEGKVNRQDVCEQFGVSANHFTREIREYKNHCLKNLEYDNTERTYIARETFKPLFSKSGVDSYLSLLRTYNTNSIPGLMSEMGSAVSCNVMPEPNIAVDEETLKKVLEAIHNSLGCEIQYISFSSAKLTKKMIWPHSLAWSGKRWHARSYDADKDQFNDIVLARIDKASIVYQQAEKSIADDDQWNEVEKFDVVPNQSFSKEMQVAVAREYGMRKVDNKYVWKVTIVKSMVGYFLDNYQLDEDKNMNGRKSLELKDQTIIEKYSFKNK